MADDSIENLDHEGWFNFAEFYSWIVYNNPNFSTFIELGVWTGRSIAFLAQTLKLYYPTGDKIHIYGVDLFENTYKWQKKDLREIVENVYDIYDRHLKREGVRNFITDIKDYSWAAAAQFDDNSVDFVFIDADHRYESVVKDIDAWLPKIKKGGIISGHDFTYAVTTENGVSQAVRERFDDFQQFAGSVWWKKI